MKDQDYLCLVTEPIHIMEKDNPMYEFIMQEIEAVTGLKRENLEFKIWSLEGTVAVYNKTQSSGGGEQ